MVMRVIIHISTLHTEVRFVPDSVSIMEHAHAKNRRCVESDRYLNYLPKYKM